jgi:hypothetical protein
VRFLHGCEGLDARPAPSKERIRRCPAPLAELPTIGCCLPSQFRIAHPPDVSEHTLAFYGASGWPAFRQVPTVPVLNRFNRLACFLPAAERIGSSDSRTLFDFRTKLLRSGLASSAGTTPGGCPGSGYKCRQTERLSGCHRHSRQDGRPVAVAAGGIQDSARSRWAAETKAPWAMPSRTLAARQGMREIRRPEEKSARPASLRKMFSHEDSKGVEMILDHDDAAKCAPVGRSGSAEACPETDCNVIKCDCRHLRFCNLS